MTNYERPQGVTVHRADGTVIPVELAWLGLEDGDPDKPLWGIQTDTPVDPTHGDRIHCEVWPPGAGIQWSSGEEVGPP